MSAAFRRIFILSLGWTFLLLGFLGLFLPILQGFLFLGIGLILLSRESRWVRVRVYLARRRWPKFGRAWNRVEDAATRISNRFQRRKKQD